MGSMLSNKAKVLKEWDLSCPWCGSINNIRIAGVYEHSTRPDYWLCRCDTCKRSFKPRKRGDDMAGKIQAAQEALPRDEFLEMINQNMTDQEVAYAKNLDLYLVKALKRQYKPTGITKNQGGRPRKELDNMPMETYPGEKIQVEQEGQVNEQAQETGNKMTIAQALNLRDELTSEVACTRGLLDRSVMIVNLAPRAEALIRKHHEECIGTLDQINKAFEATEIEV